MSTKGERCLAALGPDRLPKCKAKLPEELKKETIVSWPTDTIDLATPVLELLRTLGCGRLPLEAEDERAAEEGEAAELSEALASSRELERCSAPEGEDVFYSSTFRKRLAAHVRASDRLCLAYERLIREVVAPQLLEELRALAATGDEESVSCLSAADCDFELVYQYPPTLRVQPGPSILFRREHRDAEYGHQPGEINFWLPLTDTRGDRATIWVESQPGLGDYHPLHRAFGESARFYGTECRHKVPPNGTPFTRVSLDFRVAPAVCYDRAWMLHSKLQFPHEIRSCVVSSPSASGEPDGRKQSNFE